MMIFFSEESYQDVLQIKKWYKQQKDGLDDEFLLSLEVALNKIQRNPLSYPPTIKDARQIRLQRFPYKLVYKTYNDSIKVYGVFHRSRSPEFVNNRLK
jgi:toxin ParE1/3/4